MDHHPALNQKVTALHKSATLKITALAKKMKNEGQDVIIFAAGEPDFDTPSFVKKAAIDALEQGITKYTPSAGLFELRQALARKLKEENSIAYPAEQILVTAGAKYALFLALFSLIDSDDDEVILPAPYWVSYPAMVTLAGAKLKTVVSEKKNGFKLTPGLLEKTLSPKSKVLILNYPCNPTGATYSGKELAAFWKIIKKYSLYVIADEIYEKILFDGRRHVSFASLDKDALDRTVTVNGFSKSYSMTGWRLGYLAGPEAVVGQVSKMLDHTTSCTVSFAQKGALAALQQGSEWTEQARNEFAARRDLACKELSLVDRVEAIAPEGTFYVFCDISQTGLSAVDFASRLLEEKKVAVIPSESFGIQGYIRISFATDRDTIQRGIRRISEFTRSL